ncbi:MAG: InlB B-repeat-containing protein, partial [Treponema sp.]|nr:InlB B-repeat-containing protein [Treponema sp.]
MKKDRIANSKQNGLRNIIGFSAGNLRTTILFIILFSLFFFHLSCSIAGDLEQYKPPSEPGVCTVVFNANGGSDVPSQTLKPGDKIEPVSTAKPGHTLDGWYREAAFENKWDFDVDTVSADITLHAKWDENPSGVFTVTFFSNGGTVIDPQAIAWGASIDMPANPVREGYAFDNWYADAEYTMYFNFNVPVTADRIAYAKWNANILSISYSGGGGTGSGPSSPVTAAYGTSITMPSNTYTFPGYSFAGWELSGEGAIAGVYAAGAELAVADVSLAIAYGNAGITLTATWAYMIESIDLLAAYLNSCAVNTAEEPIPVKVNVNLDSDWPALLTVLAETGRFVDLDLSGCTGMEIFDPGTSSAGKNRVVRLVLPDSSTATAAESLWSNSTFRNFASLREVSGTAIKILGDYSFIYLPGLEKINFPAMAFIGERVF